MVSGGEKAEDAFRTIGELSAELGIQQHILRYWETRFPQLKPLQRAGNRRYYRPADAALVRRIHSLLNEQAYTIRGVQKLLAQKSPAEPDTVAEPQAMLPASSEGIVPASQPLPEKARAELHAIRESLTAALATDLE